MVNFLKHKKLTLYNAMALFSILAAGLVICYPLVHLLIESFLYEGGFSFENYVQIALQPDNYVALLRTLYIGLMVTVFATAAGIALAYLVAKTDLPCKSVLNTWIVFPYMIPPFIGAFSWTQLLGPVGYINQLYKYLTGSDNLLYTIYSPSGIIFVLTVHSYPLVFLIAVAALKNVDTTLEDAARITGATSWRVFRDITAPTIAPALMSGAILVFISAISNFGVPATLGFSNGYFVLTTRIFDAVHNFSARNHLAIASALSVALAFIAGIGLLGSNFLLKGKNYTVIGGKGLAIKQVRLGILKTPVLILVIAVIAVFSLLPLCAMVLTSLISAYGLEPVPSNWTLKHFNYVLFQMPVAKRGMLNSFFLAVAGATLATLLGGMLAYIGQKTGWRKRSILEFIAALPYSIPGTVVALSLILAYSRPIPLIGVKLYNTLWIILLAYIIRYMVFAVRSASGVLSQISPSLEEAAQVSGAGRARVLRDIIFPIVKPGLTAGWFLILIPSLHELTLSIMLWSTGNETMGVAVFNLQEAGSIQATAALALITILIILIVNALAKRLAKADTGF